MIRVIVSFIVQFDTPVACCVLFLDRKYTREHKTHNLGVVYYVRDDFAVGRDGSSLGQIERHVEEDFIVDLQHRCYRERNNSK